MITDAIDVATGSIAFVVDPDLRRRRLGRAMITALTRRPELRFAELFEAGVEPENKASRRCLEAAGFHPRSQQPDFEGMLYYISRRGDSTTMRRALLFFRDEHLKADGDSPRLRGKEVSRAG